MQRIYFNSNKISLKNISTLIRKNIENLEEPIVFFKADTLVNRWLIINLLDELRKTDNLMIGISTEKKEY